MPIKWLSTYNLGIEKIDKQHRKLVEIINLLEEAKGTDEENKVIHDTFFELVDYTRYHFEEEEKLLLSFHFSDAPLHKAQHKVLIKQVIKILEDLKKGKVEVGEDLTAILKNWLIKHILVHDKIYAHDYHSRN